MGLSIEHTHNPGGLYKKHAEQLGLVGAHAFGRNVEEFSPQVKERFEGAALAQVVRFGNSIVGFALYDVMRSSVWRCAVSGGTRFAS